MKASLTPFFITFRRRVPAFGLVMLIACLWILPVTMSAGTSDYKIRERQIRAAEQLREHTQSVKKESARQKARAQNGYKPDVGITLNPNSVTSSHIFFYDDFDANTHAWSTQLLNGTTDNLWHLTTTSSTSPTHSYWLGIEGQGNYNTGRRISNALVSPPISLAGATGAVKLLFTENYFTELGWDYCMVDVSTDGTTWTHLRGGYGSAPSGDGNGWQVATLDLSAYANQTISIRFYFDTGDSILNAFTGWYVDDIVIFDQGGVVMGRKFFDVNNNSQKDPGERGVKDWMVTASGPITMRAKTNYRGHYAMELPLGSYTVAETFEPNWTQTFPIAGTYNVNLATTDSVIDSIWFGNYIQASFINGVVFNDLNNNGVHDAGDTLLANWKILLCDTSGNVLDYDYSDSLGQYQLYIYQPGTYVVREVEKAGWLETLPTSGSYTITIPNLHTVSDSNNFGDFYSPLTNSILGETFNDRNRNHLLDAGEVGAGGFTVQLWRKGNGVNYSLYKQKVTDSSGLYQFLSVPADTYKVKEVPLEGWWQSMPDSNYPVILASGATLDSLDFGSYEIAPGSVSGMSFHDRNSNGIPDSAEEGLSGWHIILNGTTYFNKAENQSAYTDGSGGYTIGNLWPGTYTVSEVWKNGWTQTYPFNQGVNTVALGPEETRTGVNFGNVDSVYLGLFRTFTVDSLAYAVDLKGAHKPIAPKNIYSEFTFVIHNGYPDSCISVTASLSLPYVPGSITVSKPGNFHDLGGKFKKFEFDFSTDLAASDSVMIHGRTLKLKPETVTATLKLKDSAKAKSSPPSGIVTVYRLPMPDAVNVLQGLGPVRVGLGGPHSVVQATYKDVIKSLFDAHHGVHTGDARCLDKFSSKQSIKKQQPSLPPTKQNNKLFAEMDALRINIMASDVGLIPGGFGNLVYDEGTGSANPMNGLTIREIAAKADTFMSSYKDTIGKMACAMPGDFNMLPETLYTKLRNIDAAFSGAIDTVQWSGSLAELELKGVRKLGDVGFLRFDSARIQPAAFASRAIVEIPRTFTLYQNYPNPFNPTTTLSFFLVNPAVVTLKIYNMLGQEVATAIDRQSMDYGEQEVVFDASRFASGVYFYQLKAEVRADADNGVAAQTFTSVKKMVLVK